MIDGSREPEQAAPRWMHRNELLELMARRVREIKREHKAHERKNLTQDELVILYLADETEWAFKTLQAYKLDEIREMLAQRAEEHEVARLEVEVKLWEIYKLLDRYGCPDHHIGAIAGWIQTLVLKAGGEV